MTADSAYEPSTTSRSDFFSRAAIARSHAQLAGVALEFDEEQIAAARLRDRKRLDPGEVEPLPFEDRHRVGQRPGLVRRLEHQRRLVLAGAIAPAVPPMIANRVTLSGLSSMLRASTSRPWFTAACSLAMAAVSGLGRREARRFGGACRRLELRAAAGARLSQLRHCESAWGLLHTRRIGAARSVAEQAVVNPQRHFAADLHGVGADARRWTRDRSAPRFRSIPASATRPSVEFSIGTTP